MSNKGGNLATLKRRLCKENIDFSHIKTGANSNSGRKFDRDAIPLEEVCIENSTYSRRMLKKRLIKSGALVEKCSICPVTDTWNGKKLVLILDHVNGIPNDNRLENLRLVCPNCNSQLDTFCGGHRNKATHTEKCKMCGKESLGKALFCSPECKKQWYIGKRKAERPDINELLKEVNDYGYRATARKYHVSDNAVKKWIVAEGIIPPKKQISCRKSSSTPI